MRRTVSMKEYRPTHPWYYLLNGRPLFPSEMIQCAKDERYKGYLWDDIQQADSKTEPHRSETLRALKTKVVATMWRDLNCYHEFVREFRRQNKAPKTKPPVVSSDLHLNLGLKHSHLHNDFAHLLILNELLEKQADLFDAL